MLEHSDISRDPTELLREQVLLLRKIDQSMQDLQQTQTKANEEMGLLTSAMQSRSERSRTRISGIDMPIGSLIVFMLKWTVASIPVMLIVGLVGSAIGGLVWYVLMNMGYL